MILIIKTSKPNIIEEELKKSVEKYSQKWQPKGKMKFLIKLAKIDLETLQSMIFFSYKKVDENTFEFIASYPNIDFTKKMLIDGIRNEFKKIDPEIEIFEKIE